MAGFARVNEERGRAGRRERRGNLAADVTGFAHTGHDEAPLCAPDHLDGGDQGPAQAIADRRGERADPARFRFQRAQRRLDLESPLFSARSFRLDHRP